MSAFDGSEHFKQCTNQLEEFCKSEVEQRLISLERTMERQVRAERGRRKWGMRLLIGALLFCVLIVGVGRFVAVHLMNTLALTTGPNGLETPESLGVPFERVAIPSGVRQLDSYVVTASNACTSPPVIVIYHGVKETISEWVKAQRYLYDHCVSSIVFDPTGSGNSSRPASFEAMGEDYVAAYTFASKRFPGERIYVLGHSMGNGPMLEIVPHLPSRPAGVIVANAFAALRSYGGVQRNALYRILTYAIPDWWDNVKSVQQIHAPLLVIGSDTDRVNPVQAGQEIFAAAHQPKTLTILHGYNHNALYQQPTDEWWSSVLAFVRAPVTQP